MGGSVGVVETTTSISMYRSSHGIDARRGLLEALYFSTPDGAFASVQTTISLSDVSKLSRDRSTASPQAFAPARPLAGTSN